MITYACIYLKTVPTRSSLSSSFLCHHGTNSSHSFSFPPSTSLSHLNFFNLTSSFVSPSLAFFPFRSVFQNHFLAGISKIYNLSMSLRTWKRRETGSNLCCSPCPKGGFMNSKSLVCPYQNFPRLTRGSTAPTSLQVSSITTRVQFLLPYQDLLFPGKKWPSAFSSEEEPSVLPQIPSSLMWTWTCLLLSLPNQQV